MTLDKIVVIIMAILFFGGLAYIIWRGRQQEKREGTAPSPAIPDPVQDGASSKPRDKSRRGSRK